MDQLSRTAMVKRSRMVERIVKAQKKRSITSNLPKSIIDSVIPANILLLEFIL